eukprot:TRINITY_DN50_c0_g4_i1.p1 TRINITY_DN50_c0_g4~~TRINITY_DN50_c0_g4_i1.p1  ORF type:complete len:255 (-),score=95.18 TRINITY_DN50_c0_g4_i1:112-876(-)
MWLNGRRFVQWILNAILHASIVFFVPLAVAMSSIWDTEGQSDGWMIVGSTTFACLLVAVQYKVALVTRSWTKFNFLVWILSTASFFGFIALYSLYNPASLFFHVAFQLYSRPSFWLLLVCVPLLCCIVDFGLLAYFRVFQPTPIDVLAEIEKKDNSQSDVIVVGSNLDLENPIADSESVKVVPDDAKSGLVATIAASTKNLNADPSCGIRDMKRSPSMGFDFNFPEASRTTHIKLMRPTSMKPISLPSGVDPVI